MTQVDRALAWTMFLTGAVFLLIVGIWRPWGVGFDTPLFWMSAAMINMLRVRNACRPIQGVRTFAILANLMVLLLEVIRLGEVGAWIIRNWGPYYLITTVWRWTPYFIIGTAGAGELIFSIVHTEKSPEALNP